MYRQFILFFIILTLSACASNKDEKLEALLKKSKENMVFVKGGTFMMGDPGGLDNENGEYGKDKWVIGSPENRKKYPDAPWQSINGGEGNVSHKVILSDYYISKYEVTWEEFDTYYELTDREVYLKSAIEYEEDWRTPKHPTETPNWNEAKNYCRFLAKKSGLNYDLPTEAQWEYAARSRGKYVFYGTNNGWAIRNKDMYGKDLPNQNLANLRSPVGSYPPNPLGLYDMEGNMGEWTNDWYSEEYFKNSPIKDPKGPKNGEKKVARGSSYGDSTSFNLFYRSIKKPTSSVKGFRCILNP
ncbi:MAG: hypothetical protein C0625_15895 [Arcobacter sp.]|nr:MAG: hypothetical protein C0625_15895 [Arcobacter sp.]